MADNFHIRRANPDPAVAEALADLLLDCVEGGASVGFMHPLPRAKALAFWQSTLASAARGERIVLMAEVTRTRPRATLMRAPVSATGAVVHLTSEAVSVTTSVVQLTHA